MTSHRNTAAGGLSLSLILLLALFTAMDAMAIDMYLPSMPAIGLGFGVSATQVQQTLSIFLIGLAVGQAAYGPLLDRYGRRLPMLIGVVIFVVGSVVAALAPSIEWLLTARFLQALGAAAGLVTPRAIVSDRCTLAESAPIFSLLMQIMMIAPILAPIIGGFLLEQGSWRLIFWALAGIGALGLLWGIVTVPETLKPAQRSSLSISSILRSYSQQLRLPIFMAYTLAGSFMLSSLFLYISHSAFIFTQHFDLTPSTFSYLFAGNAISLVIGGQLSTSLLKRGFAETRVTYIGLCLHLLSGALLFLIVKLGLASLWSYATLIALAVGSLGLIFGNLTALTMHHSGKQAGVASALMGTLQYLISALAGYVVAFFGQGPAVLPLAIAGCALLALLCCKLAERPQPPLVQA
ncbi:Bcr/CflA family efflux MFS transporter [Alcaligenaceae bacterium 429]|uniref:multidrug effflux MFS transporter n=1 Tax=Paenalcaligenes sp. Me52 TaxID=3392038 RepID=UPI0010930084|nr:Bcr/CflA family efflux MFS transporter [Alcaligenaceae bacterium 429]